jgi:hypothetical protein
MVNWNIIELERQSTDDLVTSVHWEATLSEEVTNDGNTQTYGSRAYGSVRLERGQDFIPFQDLTKETVIGWVKDKLGSEEVARIEASLQTQIDDQKIPPILKGVPW